LPQSRGSSIRTGPPSLAQYVTMPSRPGSAYGGSVSSSAYAGPPRPSVVLGSSLHSVTPGGYSSQRLPSGACRAWAGEGSIASTAYNTPVSKLSAGASAWSVSEEPSAAPLVGAPFDLPRASVIARQPNWEPRASSLGMCARRRRSSSPAVASQGVCRANPDVEQERSGTSTPQVARSGASTPQVPATPRAVASPRTTSSTPRWNGAGVQVSKKKADVLSLTWAPPGPAKVEAPRAKAMWQGT